jgi:hypothetical protein
MEFTQDELRYIWSGLATSGDTLAECVADPALTEEERAAFLKNQADVEALIKKVDGMIVKPFEQDDIMNIDEADSAHVLVTFKLKENPDGDEWLQVCSCKFSERGRNDEPKS